MSDATSVNAEVTAGRFLENSEGFVRELVNLAKVQGIDQTQATKFFRECFAFMSDSLIQGTASYTLSDDVNIPSKHALTQILKDYLIAFEKADVVFDTNKMVGLALRGEFVRVIGLLEATSQRVKKPNPDLEWVQKEYAKLTK